MGLVMHARSALERIGLVHMVLARWRNLKHDGLVAQRIAAFPVTCNPRPHGLPGQLIISFTSYPKRFCYVANTVKGLLDQTVAADRVILWVAENDLALVPKEVVRLVDDRFAIETCRDVGPATKFIPCLTRYPEAYIVVCDDDLYYDPEWLGRIVAAYDPALPTIVTHRAHRPTRHDDGSLRPYADWQLEVVQPRSLIDEDLFPTGVGGIMFPPGLMPPETADIDRLLATAPKQDDIWFYWMARRAGVRFRHVGQHFHQYPWSDSQASGLLHQNHAGGNDVAVRAMEAEFGPAARLIRQTP